jgi:hypothetical protein
MWPVEEVALRALMYREMFLAGYTSLDDILSDSESAPGTLSFLTLIASEQMGPKDWACLNGVRNHGFLRVAREHPDPHYAEVLLHAKPPQGVKSKKAWAEAFVGDRWDEIELAMVVLARVDVASSVSHDDIEYTFSRAWRDITGGDLDDYLDAADRFREVEVS